MDLHWAAEVILGREGGAPGSGFGFQVGGCEFRVSGFGFRASGFGLRVSGCGFRVSDFKGGVKTMPKTDDAGTEVTFFGRCGVAERWLPSFRTTTSRYFF